MSWLKDRLEKGIAQLIPFDKATAVTVHRRHRLRDNPPQQIQTHYTGELPMQRLGGGLTNIPSSGQVIQRSGLSSPRYEPGKQYQYGRDYALPYDTSGIPQFESYLSPMLRERL